jgi:UDP-glucose 4-epimerase
MSTIDSSEKGSWGRSPAQFYPSFTKMDYRDYIHVMDLAQAHVLGLEYILQGNASNIFNLSNGDGFSVKEIIDAAQQVAGYPIQRTLCDRRPGDPHTLIGDSTKAREILGWQPQYPDLTTILSHAWQWHCKRHEKVQFRDFRLCTPTSKVGVNPAA